MYNSDTELLFPPRVISMLRDLRGEQWRNLVDCILSTSPTDIDRLAFVLMMVRLGGCISCHSDSFRALRGCTQCAYQTVRRFRGSDQELMTHFREARAEIESYMGR